MTSKRSKRKPVALHIITGLGDGGAEAVLYNLIRTASEFEHKVISLMGPGKYGPMMEAEGFEVSFLGLRPSLPSPLRLLKLVGMVRRAQPDVVQCWMYHADLLGGYAAWRAGVRAIVWGLHHTTLDAQGTKWSTRQLLRLNTRVSSWLPRRIITCSKKGDEVHREIGFPAEKMIVVHNGYNTAAFIPDDAARAMIRTEFDISDDQLLLGCVARYNPQKDHRNLLLGFAEVVKTRPDAHLLLIGPGLTAENAEVTALIAKMGLTDRVTLVRPRPDIPAVMNGLDLHVLGSAFGEAFPNVLSEAMSCGTACVATDVGDSATIVGETGRIVPARDSQALAAAILDMIPHLSDPAVQVACRERILGNFTLDHMVAGYTQVWRDSMATGGDRTRAFGFSDTTWEAFSLVGAFMLGLALLPALCRRVSVSLHHGQSSRGPYLLPYRPPLNDATKEVPQKEGVTVDVHESWANPDEAQREYGLELVAEPKAFAYDGIVLAIAHDEYRLQGARPCTNTEPQGHVFYDLKSVFQTDESDLRL